MGDGSAVRRGVVPCGGKNGAERGPIRWCYDQTGQDESRTTLRRSEEFVAAASVGDRESHSESQQYTVQTGQGATRHAFHAGAAGRKKRVPPAVPIVT